MTKRFMNKFNKQICPICKQPSITFYMGGQFGKYECKDCGYVGVIIVEKDENKKSRKRFSGNKKEI